MFVAACSVRGRGPSIARLASAAARVPHGVEAVTRRPQARGATHPHEAGQFACNTTMSLASGSATSFPRRIRQPSRLGRSPTALTRPYLASATERPTTRECAPDPRSMSRIATGAQTTAE